MRQPPTAFGDGFLYGLTSYGSTSGDGDVYRLDPLTGETTVLGRCRPGPPQRDDTRWASPLVDGGDGSLYALVLQSLGTDGYIVRVDAIDRRRHARAHLHEARHQRHADLGPRPRRCCAHGLVETAGGLGLFRFTPSSGAFTVVATVTPTIGLRGAVSAGIDGRLLVTTTAGPMMPPCDGVLYRVDRATGTVSLLASAPTSPTPWRRSRRRRHDLLPGARMPSESRESCRSIPRRAW